MTCLVHRHSAVFVRFRMTDFQTDTKAVQDAKDRGRSGENVFSFSIPAVIIVAGLIVAIAMGGGGIRVRKRSGEILAISRLSLQLSLGYVLRKGGKRRKCRSVFKRQPEELCANCRIERRGIWTVS